MTTLKVANCPQCGKVFQKNLRNMCHDCVQSYESDFNRCFMHLRDNRKASNEELSEATGVSVNQIVGYIKENKLMISSYPNLTYPCNSCRAPIRQHNLCASCRMRLMSDIHKLNEQEAKAKERGSGYQLRERFGRSY